MQHIKDLLKNVKVKITFDDVRDNLLTRIESDIVFAIEHGQSQSQLKLSPTESLFLRELRKELKQYGVSLNIKTLTLFWR
jgi:hypothetical protein